MEVDASEAEVAERQLRQALERVVDRRRPLADAVEELAEVVAEPGHKAIVR
jgi:hypothetical protein